MTAGSELGTVTSAVSMLTPLVVVKASGSPSMLVKLLATALTPAFFNVPNDQKAGGEAV